MPKKKKVPVFEDKEKNIKIQAWKNKNKKTGTKYVTFRLWIYAFPFKYNQKIDIMGPSQIEVLKKLLNRMPEFKIKQDKK